jgi:hypothetical protein
LGSWAQDVKIAIRIKNNTYRLFILMLLSMLSKSF